jgi:hypothetical protein
MAPGDTAVGRTPTRSAISGAPQQKLLIELINSGQKTQAQMARIFDVNRSVISRMVSKERGDRYTVKGPHPDQKGVN